MLRRLALLLVLVNLAYFAWGQGWLEGLTGLRPDTDREPHRLARQVKPESVMLLPPSGVEPGAAAPAASVAAASAAPICLEAGPFATGASITAASTVQAALPAGSWNEVKIERPGSWIVYIGRFPTREALAKKEEELKRTRVSYEEVSTPLELSYGFSLGRFDQRAAADSALEQMTQRGIRTARVVELAAPVTQHMLRIEKADKALADKALALRSETLGRGFQPCGN
jgi:hypothetical protein